jgi:hypothetical protein
LGWGVVAPACSTARKIALVIDRSPNLQGEGVPDNAFEVLPIGAYGGEIK